MLYCRGDYFLIVMATQPMEEIMKVYSKIVPHVRLYHLSILLMYLMSISLNIMQ